MNVRKFGFFLAVVLAYLPSFADQTDLASLQARAAKGDAEAELDLGRDYQLGRGVVIDYTKATNYYQQAAAQGNAKAMFNLGYIYRHGQGVAQDNTVANQWFQKAADQGLPAGQLAIGEANYFGNVGMNKDYAAAVKWLTLAAKQMSSPAQSAPAANILGSMYEYGTGVPRDGKQAVYWYSQSAEMGNAKGESNLGRAYSEGILVKRDLVAAYMWLKLAASQGEPLAVHAMSEDLVAKVFTPEQIGEGDRRVDEYQLEHHKTPITSIPFVAEPETVPPGPHGPSNPLVPPGMTNSMLNATSPGKPNSPVVVTAGQAPADH